MSRVWGNVEESQKELFPYADWERHTRPSPQRGQDNSTNWTIVYIYVAGATDEEVKQNASDLFDRINKKANLSIVVRANTDTSLRLLSLSKATVRDDLRYVFVYRPESFADVPLDDLYTVKHIGPAIPFAFLPTIEEFTRIDKDRLKIVSQRRIASDPAIVVTGIIDDAIGVMNERFRVTSGGTRVKRYWRQVTEGFPEKLRPEIDRSVGVHTGLFMNDTQLDAQFSYLDCDEQRFYQWIEDQSNTLTAKGAAGIDSLRQTMRRRISHGTSVADLAAGAPPGPTNAPIAAIELPAIATSETWGARLDCYILMAVMGMLHWADYWPEGEDNFVRASLVINLSYSLTAGPRDGTGFLEREIARHVDARNTLPDGDKMPTAVVMAAGNAYRDKRRGMMKLAHDAEKSVDWNIPPADQTSSFLEIRMPLDTDACITLTPPHSYDPVSFKICAGDPPHTQSLQNDASETVARAYWQDEKDGDGTPHCKTVTIAVAPTLDWDRKGAAAPAGTWGLSILNTTGREIGFDINVLRDESPSGFPQRSNPAWLDDEHAMEMDTETKDYTCPNLSSTVTRKNTISAVATNGSENIVVVGAAVAVKEALSATPQTRAKARYTADGTHIPAQTPHLAAYGETGYATFGILAAGTFSGSTMAINGTSAAAPQVTRAIVDHWTQNPPPIKPVPAALASVHHQYSARDPRLGDGVLNIGTNATQGRPQRRWPEV